MIPKIVLLCCIPLVVFCVDSLILPDLMMDMFKENVNHEIDPCSNFYRHACPRNLNYYNTINGRILKLFNIYNSRNGTNTYRIKITVDTDASRDAFLKNYAEKCKDHKLMLLVSDNVRKRLIKSGVHYGFLKFGSSCSDGEEIWDQLFYYRNRLDIARLVVKYKMFSEGFTVLQAMKEMNAIDRVEKWFVDLVDDLKNITLNLMDKTKWMINKNVTDNYKRAANQLNVVNFTEMYDELDRYFDITTKEMKKCEEEFADFPAVIPYICYGSALNSQWKTMPAHAPFMFMNAYNRHPYIGFSAPLFLISQISDESAKVGSIGSVTSHEIAHSIIETKRHTLNLGYFSSEVTDCIQNQFKETCSQFVEKSCNPEDKLEENGSDILGWHISYEYLKQKLGDKLHETLPGTSITNQQMYFYSAVFSLCDDKESADSNNGHTATNARLNTMVQLPEFQEAFKCEDNSPMMQSRTKQCFVIGEMAPERKIHKN